MAVGDPIKIIALPAEGAPALTRYFPETDGATTRRMTLQQFKTLLESSGMAYTAALTNTASIRVGNLVVAPASAAKLIVRQSGDAIEFGHVTSPNIAGALGTEKSGGRNYLAMQGAAGTTVDDTYRAQGSKPSIMRANLAGGFQFGTTALATGDNQAFVQSASLDAAGNFVAVGNITGVNINGAAITATGPFTSPAIDDNGTAERLQIADTVISFGPTTAASDYILDRPVESGRLSIYGGVGATGTAGGILLFGATHATNAGDIMFMSGGGSPYWYDQLPSNKHIFTGNAHISGVLRLAQDTTDTPGVGNNTVGAATGVGIIYASNAGQQMALNSTAGGNMVGFYIAGVNQGFISGAGATITYGAFMGSHLGQMYGKLVKGEELLRGSIVQTVDEMSEWLGIAYTDHDGNEQIIEAAVPVKAKIGHKFKYSYERTIVREVERIEEIDEVETQEVDEPVNDFDVIDGNAVAVKRMRKVRQPVYDDFPVVDKKGNPVLVDMPVLDADGNPKFEARPVLNRRGEPAFDRVIEPVGKKRHVRLVPRLENVPLTEQVQQIARVPRKIKVQHKRIEQVKETVTETVKATVVLLQNDTLVKWALTDQAGCERPYGVVAWKYDESDDWLISGLGAYVCRIKKGVKVNGGDLIQSSDARGCGEPITEEMNLSALQIAKRHVATVGANIPQPIYHGGPLHYPDGSYIVPAIIHCG